MGRWYHHGMKSDVATPEDAAAGAAQPNSYFGRFVRKQGQYGSVAVVGTVAGTTVGHIADPKRLFEKDGTVETHGVTQHAGLSPGHWVEFDVARNTRPRAANPRLSSPENSALRFTARRWRHLLQNATHPRRMAR